jgi:hypothetical protein
LLIGNISKTSPKERLKEVFDEMLTDIMEELKELILDSQLNNQQNLIFRQDLEKEIKKVMMTFLNKKS